MLSNFKNDKGLLIEQLKEEFSGQENQVGDRRDVDGELDGVAQLFLENEDYVDA